MADDRAVSLTAHCVHPVSLEIFYDNIYIYLTSVLHCRVFNKRKGPVCNLFVDKPTKGLNNQRVLVLPGEHHRRGTD